MYPLKKYIMNINNSINNGTYPIKTAIKNKNDIKYIFSINNN